MVINGKEMNAIWDKIVDRGISLTLLAVAVWVLWSRDNAMTIKMNTYLETDRQVMLSAIQNNTSALANLTTVLKISNTNQNTQNEFNEESKTSKNK